MEDTKYNKQNYNAIDLTKFICSILVVAIHIKPFGDNVDFHLGLSQRLCKPPN